MIREDHTQFRVPRLAGGSAHRSADHGAQTLVLPSGHRQSERNGGTAGIVERAERGRRRYRRYVPSGIRRLRTPSRAANRGGADEKSIFRSADARFSSAFGAGVFVDAFPLFSLSNRRAVAIPHAITPDELYEFADRPAFLPAGIALSLGSVTAQLAIELHQDSGEYLLGAATGLRPRRIRTDGLGAQPLPRPRPRDAAEEKPRNFRRGFRGRFPDRRRGKHLESERHGIHARRRRRHGKPPGSRPKRIGTRGWRRAEGARRSLSRLHQSVLKEDKRLSNMVGRRDIQESVHVPELFGAQLADDRALLRRPPRARHDPPYPAAWLDPSGPVRAKCTALAKVIHSPNANSAVMGEARLAVEAEIITAPLSLGYGIRPGSIITPRHRRSAELKGEWSRPGRRVSASAGSRRRRNDIRRRPGATSSSPTRGTRAKRFLSGRVARRGRTAPSGRNPASA